jgi:hypothetical protein
VGTTFPYTFSAADGTPLTYPQTVFFLGDLAIAAFAVAMIVEGVVLLKFRSKATFLLAAGILTAAVLGNLAFLAYSISTGYGMQLFSLLAVVFGGWGVVTLVELTRRSAGIPVQRVA